MNVAHFERLASDDERQSRRITNPRRWPRDDNWIYDPPQFRVATGGRAQAEAQQRNGTDPLHRLAEALSVW